MSGATHQRPLHGIVLAATFGAAAACSRGTPLAAPAVSAPPARPLTSDAERFLPLTHDSVLTYAFWLPGASTPEQLILQVERRRPEHASLRSGNEVKRLEYARDGVRLLSGGYLLKLPLSAGAEWAGPAGRVSVTAVGRAVTVPAGRFEGCLETTERSLPGAAPRVIVTTYCPDVGIAKFSVDDGERVERFELKAFGPRVDVNEL